MATTVSGVGSGIDISSIVTSLVNAQKTPKQSQITNQQSTANTQLSAIGTLQSALETFQSAMDALNDSSKFAGLAATSSKTDVVTAKLGDGATAGTYDINVTSLATSSRSLPSTSAAPPASAPAR